MTQAASRLIIILMLVIFGLLVLMMWQQRASRPSVRPQMSTADGREALGLNAEQSNHVLTEMRQLLVTVRDVQSGLAAEDWATVVKAAKAQGTARGQTPPKGLREKQSETFRMMSSDMRRQFNALAAAAENKDFPSANQAVGKILNNCVACHDSYRIEISE